MKLLIGLVLPGLAFLIIRPDGPVLWFLVPGLLALGLHFGLSLESHRQSFYRLTRRSAQKTGRKTLLFRRINILAQYASLTLYFFFLILYATSVPVEVYFHWFDQGHGGTLLKPGPPLMVLWASFWFVFLLGLISLSSRHVRSSGGLSWKSLGISILGATYCWVGLLMLLSGSKEASLAFLVAGGFYGFIRLGSYSLKTRTAQVLPWLLFVSLMMAAPLGQPGTRISWDQVLVRFMNTRFQNLPLILGIPGQGTRQVNDSFGPAQGLSSQVFFRIAGDQRGKYYLENRRASLLGHRGWFFHPHPNLLEDYAIFRSSDQTVALEFAEYWWGPVPYELTLNGVRHVMGIIREINAKKSAVPVPPISLSTPIPQGTIVHFHPGNPISHDEQTEQTHLPLPQELADLVNQAAGLSLNSQIQLLHTYFDDGFLYGLSPVVPPEGQHPLSVFLDDEIGYCLHYATFGVLYFQALGYHAYFSEGYTGFAQEEVTEVRGLDSHAWVTLVLPDGATRIVDPTPAIRFDPAVLVNHASDRVTLQYLARVHALSQPPSPGQPMVQTRNIPEFLFPALFFLIMVLGIFWGLVALRPKNRWIRTMPRHGSGPVSYQSMEILAGAQKAREYYLPSILAWYGYTPSPNYRKLLVDLRNIKDIEGISKLNEQ